PVPSHLLRKIFMKRLSALAAAAILMLSSMFAQTPDEQFSKISKDFLKGYFQANPISATATGMHDYDALLDDDSPPAVTAEINRLSSFKAQLAALRKEGLSRDNNIDYRILEENIDEMLFGLQELKELEWNPMAYTTAIGNSIASLIYQEFAPLDQRLNNAIK